MADSILVIAEQRQGKLNRASLETLVAAQQLAEARTAKLVVALPGKDVAAQAAQCAHKRLDDLYTVEHELLEPYTPDAFAAALRQLIEQLQPALVLFPHTYQVRDFAPKLAAGF